MFKQAFLLLLTETPSLFKGGVLIYAEHCIQTHVKNLSTTAESKEKPVQVFCFQMTLTHTFGNWPCRYFSVNHCHVLLLEQHSRVTHHLPRTVDFLVSANVRKCCIFSSSAHTLHGKMLCVTLYQYFLNSVGTSLHNLISVFILLILLLLILLTFQFYLGWLALVGIAWVEFSILSAVYLKN